jgi:uncharacterized membrane protein YfcA
MKSLPINVPCPILGHSHSEGTGKSSKNVQTTKLSGGSIYDQGGGGNMVNITLYILLGLVAGVLGGLLGLGGGIIIIPALIFLFGLTQQQAQGTTLALMVPPIGILAAWVYYKQGYVDLKIAAFVCLGFLIGGLFGAKLATALPTVILQKVFGVALLLTAIYMIFRK